jgi:hypothetical protein
MRKRRRKLTLPIHPPTHALRFKPEKFQHYFTLAEVSRELLKDISWIRKLERQGRIPQAKRIQRGELSIRLYSPEQVEEMRRIFSEMRPGPTPKGES